jgi:hypothetical protein
MTPTSAAWPADPPTGLVRTGISGATRLVSERPSCPTARGRAGGTGQTWSRRELLVGSGSPWLASRRPAAVGGTSPTSAKIRGRPWKTATPLGVSPHPARPTPIRRRRDPTTSRAPRSLRAWSRSFAPQNSSASAVRPAMSLWLRASSRSCTSADPLASRSSPSTPTSCGSAKQPDHRVVGFVCACGNNRAAVGAGAVPTAEGLPLPLLPRLALRCSPRRIPASEDLGRRLHARHRLAPASRSRPGCGFSPPRQEPEAAKAEVDRPAELLPTP